jgi:hypothetical protein
MMTRTAELNRPAVRTTLGFCPSCLWLCQIVLLAPLRLHVTRCGWCSRCWRLAALLCRSPAGACSAGPAARVTPEPKHSFQALCHSPAFLQSCALRRPPPGAVSLVPLTCTSTSGAGTRSSSLKRRNFRQSKVPQLKPRNPRAGPPATSRGIKWDWACPMCDLAQ